MPRSLRTLAAACALLFVTVGAAACGIDQDEVGAGARLATTDDQPSTSTTAGGSPQISLPDIPPDVTEPDDTVVEPTEPDSTLPEDAETPGGLTPEDIQDALSSGTQLSEEQAGCVASGVFAELDGDQIDELFDAADQSQVDPEIVSQFQEIVLTCVQGG